MSSSIGLYSYYVQKIISYIDYLHKNRCAQSISIPISIIMLLLNSSFIFFLINVVFVSVFFFYIFFLISLTNRWYHMSPKMAKFRRLKDLKHSKKNRYRERQTEIERGRNEHFEIRLSWRKLGLENTKLLLGACAYVCACMHVCESVRACVVVSVCRLCVLQSAALACCCSCCWCSLSVIFGD